MKYPGLALEQEEGHAPSQRPQVQGPIPQQPLLSLVLPSGQSHT